MIDSASGDPILPTVLELEDETPSPTEITINAVDADEYNRERTYSI